MKAAGWMQLVTVMSLLAAGTARAEPSFEVLGVGLGATMGAPGFTCTKPEADQERDCVKFTDTRCAGQPAGIGVLRYGETAPKGCFLDPSAHATYLDGKLQQTPNTNDSSDRRPVLKPLDNLHVTGTLTNKVFRIYYMTEKDDLAPESKLYRALRAKFGEPSDKNPPQAAKWRRNGAELKASCGRINCEIFALDRKLEEVENKSFEDNKARTRRQTAPDPKL